MKIRDQELVDKLIDLGMKKNELAATMSLIRRDNRQKEMLKYLEENPEADRLDIIKLTNNKSDYVF